MVKLEENEKPRDVRPDLVVMTTAPLDAREPYRAAALGPLRTLMDSMLFVV